MINKTAVNKAMLDIAAGAALAGHDLGPFEDVDTTAGGYQAAFRRCAKTVWLGESGLMYSLLGEKCEGR